MTIRNRTPRPMRKLPLVVMTILLLSVPAAPQTVERAPRITDREIIEGLIRLEEGQKALRQLLNGHEQRFTTIDQRFTSLEQRLTGVEQRLTSVEQGLGRLEQRVIGLEVQIQDLRQLFLWGFGLVFAGLFALFGFVVWDRRTALMPVLRRLDEMRDRQQRMEETLKRYAEKVPELAEELRATGLLQ